MNPQNATLASGGAAGAATIILNYLFTKLGWGPMPPEVQAATMILLTYLAGLFFHKVPVTPAVVAKALVVFALLPVLSLSGCATGSSSTSTSSTVAAACSAVAASNTAFQTFATTHPGVIDANGMNVEGGVMATLGLPVGGGAPAATSICAPGATINVATAETTLIAAGLQIATLLTTWQK